MGKGRPPKHMMSAAHTIDKDSCAGHIEDRQKPKKKDTKEKMGKSYAQVIYMTRYSTTIVVKKAWFKTYPSDHNTEKSHNTKCCKDIPGRSGPPGRSSLAQP